MHIKQTCMLYAFHVQFWVETEYLNVLQLRPVHQKVKQGHEGTQCGASVNQPALVSYQEKLSEISLLFSQSCSYSLWNRAWGVSQSASGD